MPLPIFVSSTGLRITHPLGTAAFIVLEKAGEAPTEMDTLIRACQCLYEMRVSLPLASDILSGIRAAFKRNRLQVPLYINRYFEKVEYRKDGLVHRAVAPLLPASNRIGRIRCKAELQLQELLHEFNNTEID